MRIPPKRCYSAKANASPGTYEQSHVRTRQPQPTRPFTATERKTISPNYQQKQEPIYDEGSPRTSQPPISARERCRVRSF